MSNPDAEKYSKYENEDVFVYKKPFTEKELREFKNIIKFLAGEYDVHLESFQRLFATIEECKK